MIDNNNKVRRYWLALKAFIIFSMEEKMGKKTKLIHKSRLPGAWIWRHVCQQSHSCPHLAATLQAVLGFLLCFEKQPI